MLFLQERIVLTYPNFGKAKNWRNSVDGGFLISPRLKQGLLKNSS